MANPLSIADVRVPTPLDRAERINLLLGMLLSSGVTTLNADGAVTLGTTSEPIFNFLEIPAAGMALDLPQARYDGQRVYFGVRSVEDSGTCVITPANFGPGTTLTLSAKGEVVCLLRSGANWLLENNVDGVVA